MIARREFALGAARVVLMLPSFGEPKASKPLTKWSAPVRPTALHKT